MRCDTPQNPADKVKNVRRIQVIENARTNRDVISRYFSRLRLRTSSSVERQAIEMNVVSDEVGLGDAFCTIFNSASAPFAMELQNS